MLDATTELLELYHPPSNHLEALQGRGPGVYSIRINRQWRVSFHWEEGHAHQVLIEDYH